MGKAQGGGSGWVIRAYSPRDKPAGGTNGRRPHDHARRRPAGAGARMYEHAYHMETTAPPAERYVDAFMEAIRWDNAVKLYEQYGRAGLIGLSTVGNGRWGGGRPPQPPSRRTVNAAPAIRLFGLAVRFKLVDARSGFGGGSRFGRGDVLSTDRNRS